MESQSGARAPLVDPFGRELEEWLRDAPATRAPYLADLVVPPVTGPVQRPVVPSDAAAERTPTDTGAGSAPGAASAPSDEAADSAFRRPRDRARHVAVCAPSFPEPPERLALRLEDLAVEVSASTGRSTIERIVLLEDEVRRRDEDLARLAAWEATVAGIADPELEAARGFAHAVFADLLADAALEADRRERSAARRAATGTVAVVAPAAARSDRPARTSAPVAPALVAPTVVEVRDVLDTDTDTDLDEPAGAGAPSAAGTPVRPVPSLPAVAPVSAASALAPVSAVLPVPALAPVSANTRPTPLVQPATGPTVIDRAAFAAALTAHSGATASTPVVLPEAVSVPQGSSEAAQAAEVDAPAAPVATDQESGADATGGWWSRLVARILRALGRR